MSIWHPTSTIILCPRIELRMRNSPIWCRWAIAISKLKPKLHGRCPLYVVEYRHFSDPRLCLMPPSLTWWPICNSFKSLVTRITTVAQISGIHLSTEHAFRFASKKCNFASTYHDTFTSWDYNWIKRIMSTICTVFVAIKMVCKY